MGDVKVSINLQDRSLTLEGSQDSLKDYFSPESPIGVLLQRVGGSKDSTSPPDNTEPHEAAIDHAWQWFSVHAGQRMQAVNFYLIAAAFLSNAYVTALKDTNFLVAAGVGILGAFLAFIFFMLEQRVRNLIRAGETALKSGEEQLAADSQISEIEILKFVDTPAKWTWPYSKVFRYLYLITGMAFFLGFIYSLLRWLRERPLTIDYSLSTGCFAGLGLLLAGSYLFKLSFISTADSSLKTAFKIVYLIIGSLCMLAGIGVLLYSFYHAITKS
jgi:hypothetical protein